MDFNWTHVCSCYFNYLCRHPVVYNAYFGAGSDPEFTVTPQTGELLPQGTNGTLLKINFLPNVYGKLYQAKLIVQVYVHFITNICISLNQCWIIEIQSNLYIKTTQRNLKIQSNLYIKTTQGNLEIQSNLYIKATQENLKMWPLWAFAHYIQVNIICTFH